jgi:prepilin-type N-terminal cleavage/methylation domain-containing protein
MEHRAGMTLIEMAVVLVVATVLGLMAVPSLRAMFADQRVKGAARSVADALMLARAEAIRTGDVHLVVFQQALGATAPIAVVDDGPPATSNCQIDAGEVRQSVPAERDVFWGTTTTLANGTPAPDDPGVATGAIATGSSFSDATRNPANPATWVLFEPDGIPRLFTPGAGACAAVGQPGQGGGAIYLTNTRRDYAVVLSNLGTTRVHAWDAGADGWRN